MKRTFLTLIAALFCCTTMANELKSFNDVEQFIASGGLVRFVVDFNRCRGDNAMQQERSIIGSFQPNSVLNFKGFKLAASNLHFTLNNPEYRGQGIYESTTFDLFSSQHLGIKSVVLNAQTMEPLSDTKTWQCVLGKSAKIFTQ